MKKTLSVLLGVLLLAVSAARAQFTYTNLNGAITITGYTGPGGAVTIPATISNLPVTGIADDAFRFNDSLTSVTIRDSITSIGEEAFMACGLTNLVIPASVNSIGSDAFNLCDELTSLYFTGNAPASLGVFPFALIYVGGFNGPYEEVIAYARPGTTGWTNFTQATGIPVQTWNIPGGSLQVTLLPDAVAAGGAQWQVDGGSWQSSGLTLYNLALGRHTVSFAPVGNWITPGNQTVTISSNATASISATYLREFDFTFITNNGAITITSYVGPGGAAVIPAVIHGRPVTGISDQAFSGDTNLTSVAIPVTVTNLGYGVFFASTNLTAITVDAHNPVLASVDGVLFNKRLTTLRQCPWGRAGSYTVPAGVTTVGSNAFDSCFGLTNILLPNTLTNIESAAFANLPGLVQISLPNHLLALGDYAFDNCPNLAGITLPDSLVTLGDYVCYDDTGLTNVIFGSRVKAIGAMDFYYCTGLSSLTLPNSVTRIGDNAFDYCLSLAQVTLPAHLTDLGGSAFADCQILTQINLPDSLTDLGQYAFYDGFALASVTLPKGLKNIGDYTFYGCTSLTSFTIPNTVTNVGSGAFYGCTGLGDLTIPGKVSQIGQNAFSSCSGLTNVIIANGVGGLGDFAFEGCHQLTTVFLGGSVTNLGEFVFGDCPDLVGVYFQGNAPATDGTAFLDDNQPTVYYLAGTSGWTGTFAGEPAVLISTGSLTVTLSPAAAVSAGAQWRVDFGSSQNSGDTVASLSPGIHTVSFSGVSGWLAPAGRTVSVSVGATTNVSGAYTQLYTYESAYIYLITNDTVTITGYTGPGGAVTIPATINGLPVTQIGLPGPAGLAAPVVPLGGRLEGSGNWQGVTRVTIPEGVLRLGPTAFWQCLSLTNVSLPASVTNIGTGAFGACNALTAITVAAHNPDYSSMAGVLFNQNRTTLLQYPGGLAGSYTIPAGVTSIGNEAFAEYPTPVSVNYVLPSPLPPPIFPISPLPLPGFPIVVTNYPGILPNNRTPNPSRPNLIAKGAGVANAAAVASPALVANGSSAGNVASGATGLTGITIPASVTSIGIEAFYGCTGLTQIVLPDRVASLGINAFLGCTNLTGITIPASLVGIGAGAFSGCTALTAITVARNNPEYSSTGGVLFDRWQTTLLQYPAGLVGSYTVPGSVTSIGTNAFAQCGGLGGIAFPNSITHIDDGAFESCTSLTAVVIPNGVTHIGNYAFEQCSGLTGLILPDSVTSLGDGAFELCTGLVSVTLSDQLTQIGSEVFFNCSALGGITIPNGVTSIGNSAFAQCGNLGGITIPDSVTQIGPNAFLDSGLTSVTIPDSVNSIGDGAFEDCYNLTFATLGSGVTNLAFDAFNDCNALAAITVDPNNPAYSSVAGVLFDEDQTTLIQCPAADNLGAYTIPGSVNRIADSAFSGCESLTSVTIPQGVADIGNETFENCSSLTSIMIPDTVTTLGDNVFQSCFGLTNATIGNGVVSLGSGAFSSCYDLISVTLGNQVARIGSDAFEYCTSLTSLAIPANVLSIGSGAFAGCTGLTAITVDPNNAAYSSGDGVLFNQGQTILIQYPQAAAGAYAIPGGVLNIAVGAFNGCVGLTEVTIPSSVTSGFSPSPVSGLTGTGNSAFTGCTGLTAITVDPGNPAYSSVDGVLFNENQTTLLQYPEAKAGAYTIPGSVTNISTAAFNGCRGLTNLVIPGSVGSVGASMFSGCYNLIGVTMANGVTSIGAGAFASDFALSSITIPNSVTNLGSEAFENCGRLTSVTIPSGVTSIGDYAFADCYGLTNVYFTGNAPVADTTVFADPLYFYPYYNYYSNPTIYYDPGTLGWGLTFAGLPTMEVNTPTGSLLVNLTSGGPFFFGGQWQVDGGVPRSSGTTIAQLAVGTHTVSFNPVSGWVTPGPQTIWVSSNATTTVTGVYLAEGSLQVTIGPAAAVNAGAEWRVNGGAYQTNGTIRLFPTGTNLTVSFKPISGWTTPANQTVAITNGQTSSLTATYRDNLKPSLAIVTPKTSGLTVSNATYTITGTAADNAGVGGVWYQVNNGAWMLAATTNQWTNWSATLTLTPGNNTVHAYAEDIYGDGFLYVADAYNNLIRKLTPAGVVTTLAGDTYALTNGGYNTDATAANFGYADGPGTNALFNYPNGTVVDGSGNVYVADAFNNLIRKVTAAGVVTTFAGDVYDLTNGSWNIGYADGTGEAVQFSNPSGVALDGAGNLYVADSGNNLIRKISPAGVVTTLAGRTNGLAAHNNNAGGFGYVDGPGDTALFYGPSSVAVDGAGNVYVADEGNNLIREITPDGVVSTLAGDTNGLTAGYADGPGGTALFNSPTGVAVDGSGNVYVADRGNNRIREISPEGVVSTLAGGGPGLFADGLGATASFQAPISVAVDRFGTVFVVDQDNNLIRQVTPAGVVSTLAGDVYDLTNTGYNAGYADGPAATALFNIPAGVAVDGSSGNCSPTNALTINYVPSSPLEVLVVGEGTVSPNYSNAVLALGGHFSLTATAKPGSGFAFTNWMLSAPSLGTLITNRATLQFTMVSNLTLTATFVDVQKPTEAITGLANGQRVSNGNFTVTGTAGDNVGVAGVWYQLNNGNWTSATSTNGWTNWWATLPLAPGTNTLRTYARDINSDGFVYVADSENNLIRKITRDGVVTTLAGDIYDLTNGGNYNGGYADGTGANARFNLPYGPAVDGSGNIYVADTYNNLIRKITPAGVVTTLAGDVYDLTNGGYSGGYNGANAGCADGAGNAAQFNQPSEVAADGSGNVYVADTGNNLIRKITPAGVVTTLAGDRYDLTNGGYTGGYYWDTYPANAGYADGPGAAAKFNYPAAVAVDESGKVYVADAYNDLIRQITPAGVVTTLAGNTYALTNGGYHPGYSFPEGGYADGPGTNALFNFPCGTAVDAAGNVYVADSQNNLMRQITPAGLVTTLAGDSYDLTNEGYYVSYFANAGYTDGSNATARFNLPSSTAVDDFGNVFVADLGNNLIRQITAGMVTTLAGGTSALTNAGYADGVGATAGFYYPNGVAVDESGGNLSATNTVTFDYVVTNTLQVQVVGLGTLSPNYSNAWLEVGRNYSVTATPAAGFVFTNWMMATNGPGGVVTNQPTVQFMMASNLTLTGTFMETAKPVVAITNLAAVQRTSNKVITVKGTAGDNWRVAKVWCEVGGNGWLAVSTTNNYQTWFATNLSLSFGTNVIRVYAENAGGNYSTTNSVTVVATNVLLTTHFVAAGVIAPSGVVITGVQMTAGGLQFNLQITGAVSGSIQASANLINWAAVTNFAGTNTTLHFRDPGATNAGARFYRVEGE